MKNLPAAEAPSILNYPFSINQTQFKTTKLCQQSEHNSPYTRGIIHGVLNDMLACLKELVPDDKPLRTVEQLQLQLAEMKSIFFAPGSE